MLNVLSQRLSKYTLQKVNRLTSARMSLGRTWYFAFGANMDAELLAKKSLFPQASHPSIVDGFQIEISSPCEMKDKGFARQVDRSQINECEALLGIPLEEFIGITLDAMKGVAGELGL